jgi:hypothetical protein
MPLTSRFAASIAGLLTATPDLSTDQSNIVLDRSVSFLNGTLAGQADRIWKDINTLAASANTDIDLAGTLTDSFGATVTFARIKALIVSADAANTNNVVVGAAASNPWIGLLGATHTLTVRPGATVAVSVGGADLTSYAVTAGTGDLLRVANSGAGTSVTYSIAIIGCSA